MLDKAGIGIFVRVYSVCNSDVRALGSLLKVSETFQCTNGNLPEVQGVGNNNGGTCAKPELRRKGDLIYFAQSMITCSKTKTIE